MPEWAEYVRPRLAALRLDPSREAEIIEELSQHLDQRYGELCAGGATDADARRLAIEELQEPDALAEHMRPLRQAHVSPPVTPAAWGGRLLSNLWQDVRFALRSLKRTPWFTAAALLTLALAIGANTTVFSLLDAVLLRPLPYREPDRLVEIWGRDAERGSMRVPAQLLEALRERSTTLASIAPYRSYVGTLRTPDGPARIDGMSVPAEYMDMLGVLPLAGRTFVPQEDDPAAPAVIVVSYRFWQRWMGGDPSAVGRTIYLTDVPYTVVGIMPPEFQTEFGFRPDDFWTPHVPENVRAQTDELGYELVGRLAPGVTIEQSRRELHAIASDVGLEGWGAGGRTLDAVQLIDVVVGDSAYMLQILYVAVAAVLAIACANLALLSLARSDRRLVEFATRRAIGASPFQLVRLALIESLVLSEVGGMGGIALSYGLLLPGMLALAPSEIPRIAESAIDGRVLAVAVGLMVLTGCAFGLAPAWRLSRLSAINAMQRGRRGLAPKNARFRAALVIGQVAASVALLVLTGLLGRTFLTLLPSNPGFEPRSRTVFSPSLPRNLFAGPADRVLAVEELVRRIGALPGVEEVGMGSNVPFGSDDGFRPVRDLDGTGPTANFSADLRIISANYFQLLQMPLTRGRGFTSVDTSSAPGVAIVNETLARKLASGVNVLGRRLRIEAPVAVVPLAEYEIVGVVADARSSGATVDVWNEVYIPYDQGNLFQFFYLIVQSPLDSQTLNEALREEIRAVVPQFVDDPADSATAMEDLVSQSLAGPRFSATLISAFSANALLLAAIGVFGLMAYSVSERRLEFGIRAALGAHPRNLLVITMRSAITLTALGVGLGIAIALYLTRFVESQLYAIEPLDVPTFIGAAAVMAVVAGLAAYVPARRASRTNPTIALRYD